MSDDDDVPKRRTRRPASDLRALIVDAAGVEFRANGYDGATTAAIARRADVTEAQLFRYFGSKANLFRQAVFDPIDRHLLQFNEPDGAASQVSFDEASGAYVEQLRTFITDNAAAFLSVLSAQRSGASAEILPAQSLDAYFDHGANLLRSRPAAMAMDPQLAVRIAFASVLGASIFRDWLFAGGRWSEAEINAAISDFILGSIGAD